MRTLIIENDHRPEPETEKWCKKNHGLLGPVEVLSQAKHHDLEEMVSVIRRFDTFIIHSTFSTYGQLEEFLEGFDKDLFGPGPFTFFVHWLGQSLERWFERDRDDPTDYSYSARMGFRNHDEFSERLIRLETTGKIRLYGFDEHYFSDDEGVRNHEKATLRYRYDLTAGEWKELNPVQTQFLLDHHE